MKKGILLLALVAVGAGIWWWQHDPVVINPPEPPRVTHLEVGLTTDDQKIWHRNPEGSEMLPLSFFKALRDHKTGKPFIQILDRFGFLVDGDDPDYLPVGWSRHQDHLLEMQVINVGVNCAACHTGEIHYKGERLRIDGAPNMVDVEAYANDLKESLLQTIENPLKGFRFLRDVVRYHHQAEEEGEFLEIDTDTLAYLEQLDLEETSDDKLDRETAEFIGDAFEHAASKTPESLDRAHQAFDERAAQKGEEGKRVREHVGEVVATLKDYSGYLKRRIQYVERLQAAMDDQTDPGPGRADSFDLIRDLLWTGEHSIAMSAPVSVPHLFNFTSFQKLHWDGNTNSVMQRNVAQAVALGADYDPESKRAHVLPWKIHELEEVAHKLKAPRWPEDVLGELDAEKVKRGKVLFGENCQRCHQEETLVPLEEVGTDPKRLTNFNERLGDEEFPDVLNSVAKEMEEVVFDDHGITGAEAVKMSGEDPWWKGRMEYISRPLDGIWATAPYLHNASVPTLHDLLLPASERPASFPVGHREFNPVKVGYVDRPKEVIWTFDTSIEGNSNRGHEFGTHLGEGDRMDLIEYLKSL